MIPGVKNASRWWSSFVYSLFVDPFHDVLEIDRLLPAQESQIAAGEGVGPSLPPPSSPPPVVRNKKTVSYLSGQGLSIAIAKASCDPMVAFGIELDHQNRFLAIFQFF